MAGLPLRETTWAQPAGAEFQVNTYTTGRQTFPAVAANADGNFVVVWDSLGRDGGGEGVFGQRFTSAGAAVGAEFQVNTYTTNDQTLPAVAADADGNFVVVWSSNDQDGSSQGVFGQRFTSTGAAVGAEFQVNTATTNEQALPAVAADADGNFVVVWYSNEPFSGLEIFARRYASTGAAIGAEFQVNTYTTGYQLYPGVAADADGDFVVVWESYQIGIGRGVFAQRYTSAGAAVGAEFQVNTYTTGFHGFRPAVATDADGDFIVVWYSLSTSPGTMPTSLGSASRVPERRPVPSSR